MNNKMNILKAIGIITVVIGHTWSNVFAWFPTYSFHMALFMFISGYFFKYTDALSFIKKKIQHLLIPLLLWNIFYGLFVQLLINYGVVKFNISLSVYSLFLEPIIGVGCPFYFNLPGWFVGTLLLVQIVYYSIYKCLNNKQMICGGVMVGVHSIALWIGYHNYQNFGANFGLAIGRVFYFLIFYHLGYLYNKYFEKYDAFSFNKIIFLAIINGIILGFVNNNITANIHLLDFPTHKQLLPLIVGCTGIWFYVLIAELLKDKVKENELLSYIGKNTFSIMMHHQFFFWLFNTFLLLLKKFHILALNTFNYDKYQTDIYFRITAHYPASDLFYILCGVFGPLICCYIYDSLKIKYLNFLRTK